MRRCTMVVLAVCLLVSTACQWEIPGLVSVQFGPAVGVEQEQPAWEDLADDLLDALSDYVGD